MYVFFKTVKELSNQLYGMLENLVAFLTIACLLLIVNVEKPNMVLCKSNFVGIYSISGEPIGRRFEITWEE